MKHFIRFITQTLTPALLIEYFRPALIDGRSYQAMMAYRLNLVGCVPMASLMQE